MEYSSSEVLIASYEGIPRIPSKVDARDILFFMKSNWTTLAGVAICEPSSIQPGSINGNIILSFTNREDSTRKISIAFIMKRFMDGKYDKCTSLQVEDAHLERSSIKALHMVGSFPLGLKQALKNGTGYDEDAIVVQTYLAENTDSIETNRLAEIDRISSIGIAACQLSEHAQRIAAKANAIAEEAKETAGDARLLSFVLWVFMITYIIITNIYGQEWVELCILMIMIAIFASMIPINKRSSTSVRNIISPPPTMHDNVPENVMRPGNIPPARPRGVVR